MFLVNLSYIFELKKILKIIAIYFTVEKPTFIVPPENQSIHDLKSVSTKVLVHGVPTPSISWLKDDKPIDFSTLNSSQEKAYSTTTNAKSTDQVESVFEINKFRANDVGTVRIFYYY